jgi:hypothetical protein
MSDASFGVGIGTVATMAIIILGGGAMYGCPQYAVYQQRMTGEAELAQAEYSKQVQVRDAQGKLDAAKLLAQVEVQRAEGVAKANQIIGESLRNNEAYLKYLWITDVTGNKTPTVIYVPTEANIPILEAGHGRAQMVPPK